MIRRASGTILALVVTAIALAGIILLVAYDLLGAQIMSRAWGAMTTPAPSSASAPALASAKDITFFTETPVPGRSFSITTGVRFADTQPS